MSQDESDKLDNILDAIRESRSEIDRINRGLYGDEINKQPGLMQKHYDLKADVDSLKKKDERRTWFIAGATGISSLGVPFVIDWLKGLFKQ